MWSSLDDDEEEDDDDEEEEEEEEGGEEEECYVTGRWTDTVACFLSRGVT